MKNMFKVQILPLEEKDGIGPPIIIISSDLEKQINTVNGQKILLKTRNKIINCTIDRSSSAQSNTIRCSSAVLKALFLPSIPVNLYLKIHPSKELWEFGPFIGIVTDHINKNHFGTIHTFLEELQLYGYEQHLFIYVFSFENYEDEFVNGFTYSKLNEDWVEASLPIPHAVHNRIHSRLKERSDPAILFFNNLHHANIPFFNERYLNKWNVYEILSQHEHLLPYIPETRLLNGKRTLEDMVNQHNQLFLKPVHGSQGKHIFKVEQKNSEFILDYTTFSGEIENSYSSLQLLYEVIKPRLQKQRYIIQQGLPLLKYEENRLLDFRLLCHRKNETIWNVTSIVTRVSSKNQFVSNLARGGEIFKINKALASHFDMKTIKQIEQVLKEIALEAATIIDQQAEGIYGELGVDLALDQDGRPWIIEINTKPSKNQEPDGFSPKIRPSAKAILDYCYNLSGWKI